MTEQAMKTLFCQISKVDEEKRTVTGIGASEAVDGDGEIFDYETSKPYVEAWSGSAQARSRGKSFGNIREMHQLSAAGKLAEPVLFDDTQKLMILTSYVSDDDAWQKCLDGTYTGYSICGPVVGDKWSDAGNPGVKRFTCAPIEFSLVDLPCNPEAVFTAVKAGGATEQRKFMQKEPPVAKTVIAQKSMYSISDLASIICSLRWTQDDLVYERDYEGDGSPIPDKLKGAVTNLCEILVDLAREESAELVSAMKAAGENKIAAKALAALQKTAADPTQVPEADPSAKAAAAPQSQGASPENGETPMDEIQKASLAKAQSDAGEAVTIAKSNQEALTQLTEAVKAQAAAGEKQTELLGKLAEMIGGQPVAAKSVGAGAAESVALATKTGTAAEPDSKDPQHIAKAILSNPKVISERELNIGR